ncbi:MAG: DNA polymerase II [Gammaproteobacteria bacterium]|nr:DNA polymerase II [Gammaproteobacteria bacterium]
MQVFPLLAEYLHDGPSVGDDSTSCESKAIAKYRLMLKCSFNASCEFSISVINAFLLTRQVFDTNNGVQIELWFSSDQGPIKVVITHQQVLFFIRQEDTEQARQLLRRMQGIMIKPLELKNFDNEAMAAVYFNSQQQFYRARDVLKQNNIRCLESDIRPAERYLSERFLTGPVCIHSDKTVKACINPRITATDYQPEFKLMSFDIETDFETDELFSIAFVTSQYRRVLMVGGNENNNKRNNDIEYLADEKVLLQRFLKWIEEIDPDVFIGWNVINFDFWFLQKKADQLKLPLTIGRNKAKAYWRQQQNDENRHFLMIPGRVVLDGIDTLKSATYSFSSFSLESVGHELLGRGKLIGDGQKHGTDHHDPLYKAKEIQRQFREEKATLAAYNLEDCQLVWDIFNKTELVNFAIERARLTGLEMDRVGGSVAAFDNLYLPRLHRKGYVAPNIGDYEAGLSAPGGYVMESVPGMHDSVLVLDYKSLYPSIIRTFNVDPYGRIAALDEEEGDTIAGYDGASFSKKQHILPGIIAQLWLARDKAKAEKNNALSQAIKIIMNSFYGVLGTPGCRIHDSRLTSSITKRSHDVILQTVELIEDAGYSVIYGDTDSVFVSLGKRFENQQADVIGRQLTEHVNQFWQVSLKAEYGIDSCLEMEYETHFIKFFMPTIRGSEKGSKKRYAGMIEDHKGNRQLLFKGLETVRTDWTALAKDFQQVLYEKVFNDELYDEYIRQLVTDLKAGKYDARLIYRKRLRQKLKDYIKNVPPHAQAAIKAEKYFAENNMPSRYKNASWIEYVITDNGPETTECKTSKLNYEHYIEKQLTPIADTILSAMGGSMDSVIQDQFELF